VTCASCGAVLAEGAEWCSLCFARVEAIEAPAYATQTGMTDAEAAATIVTPETSEAGGDVDAHNGADAGGEDREWYVVGEIGDHQLIASGETKAWRCGVCGHSEWLEVTRCPVCETSLFSAEEVAAIDLKADPAKAVRWSVIPGGGLWYVGLKMQGVTLATLVALCAGAVFMFPMRGSTFVGVAIFAVTAVLLWAVGGRDAREVAITGRADSMLLYGRRLFWVALAILGLLLATGVLALVAGAVSQPASLPTG
jgi:uncharacterized OB-fold protein